MNSQLTDFQRYFYAMGKVAAIFCLVMLVCLASYAQIGCRKNSTGVLYQTLIILSSDYDNNQQCCNVANSCLPVGSAGTPCTIRIPLTAITFAGTYGNYSPVHCDLDDHLPILIGSALLFGGYIRLTRRCGQHEVNVKLF